MFDTYIVSTGRQEMEVHKYRGNHHAMLNASNTCQKSPSRLKKTKHDNLRFPCDISNEADKGNNKKTHPENRTAVYYVLKMTNKRRL